MSTPRSLLNSAKTIAACTLLSRVTGLLRDVLLAHAFGQGRIADAFNFGFLIPNIFRRLFGEGALNAVFVPIFARTLETGGRPAAWELLARTLTLMTLTLSGIVVLIEGVVLCVWLLSADPDRGLVLGLTAIMAPFMVSVCVLALFSSILNCLGSFAPGALASVVLNLATIAGLVWLGPLVGGSDPESQCYGVAISVVLAGVLQLLFVWPWLRSHGVPIRWSLQTRDPAVRTILSQMGPVLIGQGALLLSTYVDAQLCLLLTNGSVEAAAGGAWQPLREGALTAVTNAQRLYQFPLGVLVISLATAALPEFSRLAARGDWGPWATQVRSLLRLAIFEGLLAGMMMIVLAEPLIRLLFEYGRFDGPATQRAASVLVWYGVGMWAFCAMHIVMRSFYSLGDVRTPLRLACALLPANLLITLALVWLDPIRESAFAIASAVTASLNVIVGLVLLRKKAAAAPGDGRMGSALARMLIAVIAAGAVAYAFDRALVQVWPSGTGPEFVRRCVHVFGGLGVGTTIYLVTAALLGLPEPGQLLGKALSRRVR